ncbi:hypothetical protein PF008_g7654 [Phytophthora fragariae]|uniref:Kazal-like domain-containing protein n=1 Tax=Phytophthora fragariae TaxID=53985 RepID=A0A6G0S3K6_9STRA|nr:hypothetical protein PF008_g7654 [Phytophthora fragariae]
MKFAAVAVLASLVIIGISADGSTGCGRDLCPDDAPLVCGSNGVTYENQCEFDLENCLNGNSEWTVLHNNTSEGGR